jgi:carboxyl-terminal processing protease
MRRWLFILILFLLTDAAAQKIRDFRKEALLLKETLLKNHFQAKTIDDRFSLQVFSKLLKELDPYRIYFTEEDVRNLRKYERAIDDELNGNGWSFFNALQRTYQQSLNRSITITRQLLQAPFNFQAKEYYSNDTSRWMPDEKELITKQRLWLKYLTLQQLSSMAERMDPKKDFVSKYEPEARQRVMVSQLRKINRMLKHPSGFENLFATRFFKAITAVFDPHTNYLSATDMENFMSMLSTEGYYFGITLEENDLGEVSIASLTPGGPAWKSGELNTADVLLVLKWENKDSVDMTNVSLEEANEILSDANHATAEVTVRKADGLQKTVRIRKTKVSSEDSYVRSFVLYGKFKIGYISLPDFYTRWGETSEGSRCASDVAKEILKLKKEKIDGLILDIRYNGGGAMLEAIAMAGIFIDEGTLGFFKDREGKIQPMKDINRGTVYDGPLLLIVNGQSASASEFLAAALQDYNRGIIAGSRTFGKATAQNIFSLDQSRKIETTLASIKNDIGYATITTGKLYRTTGKTAQGRGVTPDINLPDIFQTLDIHEEKMDFALSADSVSKKSYFKPFNPLPLKELRNKSMQRIDTTKAFAELKSVYSWLSQMVNKKEEPVLLSWQQVYKDYKETALQKEIVHENYSNPSTVYEVENSEMDNQRNAVDEYAKEFSRLWTAKLKNDVCLKEAFFILCDYIDLSKKP